MPEPVSPDQCIAEMELFSEIMREVDRAREKHGDWFMGNLPLGEPTADLGTLLKFAGHAARFECEDVLADGPPSRLAVLVEEVAEFAESGERHELVQVCAMAFAWLMTMEASE